MTDRRVERQHSDTDAGVKVDEDFFRHHLSLWDPTFVNEMQEAIPFMLRDCPMTQSDTFGGFWVVSSYEGVVKGYQDWRTFSSRVERSIPPIRPDQPVRRPIDIDPPIQRRYRQLLNPYLTPDRLAPYEPWIRNLATSLIDAFAADGRCDLTEQFTRPLPGRMLFRLLFGIDDADVPRVQRLLHNVVFHPAGPDTPADEKKFVEWIYSVIAARRAAGTRQTDIIDALLYQPVEDRLLTDDEIMAAMYVLVQGGFGTTSDAIGNAMVRLATHPDLQQRLRDEPELIPLAIDEFLRFDPPVTGQSRICTQDTVFRGEEIEAGDRLFMFISAANRDPAEFEHPDRLDIDRPANRHLTFGVGPHRCIGSNVARLNLRIALEELLSRLADIRITDGETVLRQGSISWGPSYLPLSFRAD